MHAHFRILYILLLYFTLIHTFEVDTSQSGITELTLDFEEEAYTTKYEAKSSKQRRVTVLEQKKKGIKVMEEEQVSQVPVNGFVEVLEEEEEDILEKIKEETKMNNKNFYLIGSVYGLMLTLILVFSIRM